MNEEIIYKLLKSSIKEDIVLAINYILVQLTHEQTLSFFEKYKDDGYPKLEECYYHNGYIKTGSDDHFEFHVRGDRTLYFTGYLYYVKTDPDRNSNYVHYV